MGDGHSSEGSAAGKGQEWEDAELFRKEWTVFLEIGYVWWCGEEAGEAGGRLLQAITAGQGGLSTLGAFRCAGHPSEAVPPGKGRGVTS